MDSVNATDFFRATETIYLLHYKVLHPEENFNWFNKIVLLTAFDWFKKIFWLYEINFCSSDQIRLGPSIYHVDSFEGRGGMAKFHASLRGGPGGSD